MSRAKLAANEFLLGRFAYDDPRDYEAARPCIVNLDRLISGTRC